MKNTKDVSKEFPLVQDNVVDIAIPEIEKRRFRINGGAVIELNTSDVGIITRLENLYANLNKLAQEASSELAESMSDASEDEISQIVKASDSLKKIDSKMRNMVDEIFDAPVSEACTPVGHGTMFDPLNGEFRFEHIIKSIANLYEKSLSKEFDKVATRMKRHTSKYTGK